MAATVKQIDLRTINQSAYKGCFVGCVVLTQDNKIMLQQRGHDFISYPDYLCEFGGRIEANEEPMQALIRELKEELGANVDANDVLSFGAITESMSNHSELVYVYFWHDKQGSITGCYEGTAKYFDHADEIVSQPKITEGLRWLLGECRAQGLI